MIGVLSVSRYVSFSQCGVALHLRARRPLTNLESRRAHAPFVLCYLEHLLNQGTVTAPVEKCQRPSNLFGDLLTMLHQSG